MEIRRIAVIGSGTMGGGIAQVASQSGYEVILSDVSDDLVQKGFSRIRERLEQRVNQGKLTAAEAEKTLSRIRPVGRLDECGEADLVIEAVVEREETKRDIFRQLDALCPDRTIFTSNTSSLSITRLSQTFRRPERFAGMHFMNPAFVMPLLEVVRGHRTSGETIAAITRVGESMGKEVVVVEDSPGFVTSRVLLHMINDAVFCLQEGVASREDIDAVMRLGAHHPMGPLELADFMGLDICLAILGVLHAELGEKYRPCLLLRRMVEAGKLGRKSGEGFYEYR